MNNSDLSLLIVSLQIGVTYPFLLLYTCQLLGGIL
jgi:hypothetical protein